MAQAAVVMGRRRIGIVSLANFSFMCRFFLGFSTVGVGCAEVTVEVVGAGAGVVGILGLRFSFSFSFPTDFSLVEADLSEFLLTFVEASSVETVTAGARKMASIKYCGTSI